MTSQYTGDNYVIHDGSRKAHNDEPVECCEPPYEPLVQRWIEFIELYRKEEKEHGREPREGDGVHRASR